MSPTPRPRSSTSRRATTCWACFSMPAPTRPWPAPSSTRLDRRFRPGRSQARSEDRLPPRARALRLGPDGAGPRQHLRQVRQPHRDRDPQPRRRLHCLHRRRPTARSTSAASNRASLYQSFYRAALEQHLPPDTILKLLRVHSYDVDFKQKVRPGDTFEVFFDADGSDESRDWRTALHLHDRRRRDAEILSLPHPGRHGRLL